MNFKSAFDKVDRKILWEAILSERRREILERIKKIYESTKNVVKVNRRVSERFWTEKETKLPAKPNFVFAANSRYRRRNEKKS